jgi:Zn-finger protein
MQQKTNPDFTILLIAFIVIIAALISCQKIDIDKQSGHKCKWQFCPYKGVLNNQYGKAVAAYTGTDGGDAYSIDILHLEFPAKEYDELEQMLFED